MAATAHEVFELDGVEVKLSSPDKVYFPHCGETKGRLAHFYVDCAEAVLNHLRERPTVLKRYAGGIEAKPFYQKHVPEKRPEWLQTTVLTFPRGTRPRIRPGRRSAPRVGRVAGQCVRSLWKIDGAGHTGGIRAQPAEYERRVVACFDGALL